MRFMLELFFKKKPKKEKLNCLGIIDCKPYSFFEPGLQYAKDQIIDEGLGYKVYARLHQNTVFLFILVEDETNFDYQKFTVHNFSEQIKEKITDSYRSSILLMVFKNSNEKTISIAKNVLVNTKKEFNQILVFNQQRVRLEYYRPVPNFYNLYKEYLEALYYDLSCIDHS